MLFTTIGSQNEPTKIDIKFLTEIQLSSGMFVFNCFYIQEFLEKIYILLQNIE